MFTHHRIWRLYHSKRHQINRVPQRNFTHIVLPFPYLLYHMNPVEEMGPLGRLQNFRQSQGKDRAMEVFAVIASRICYETRTPAWTVQPLTHFNNRKTHRHLTCFAATTSGKDEADRTLEQKASSSEGIESTSIGARPNSRNLCYSGVYHPLWAVLIQIGAKEAILRMQAKFPGHTFVFHKEFRKNVLQSYYIRVRVPPVPPGRTWAPPIPKSKRTRLKGNTCSGTRINFAQRYLWGLLTWARGTMRHTIEKY